MNAALSIVGLAMLIALNPAAQATPFVVSNCPEGSVGCAGKFGTVHLSQNGSTVDVSLVLVKTELANTNLNQAIVQASNAVATYTPTGLQSSPVTAEPSKSDAPSPARPPLAAVILLSALGALVWLFVERPAGLASFRA